MSRGGLRVSSFWEKVARAAMALKAIKAGWIAPTVWPTRAILTLLCRYRRVARNNVKIARGHDASRTRAA